MWSQRGFQRLCVLRKCKPIIKYTRLDFGAGKAYYILGALGQECKIPLSKYQSFIDEIGAEISK